MTDDNDFEIISMAPDMPSVWGKLTKTLRDGGEYMLYNLFAHRVNVFFDRENIEISAKDETMHQMLLAHIGKIEGIIGKGILEIHPPKTKRRDSPKAIKLREIFGEKLRVVKNK